MAIELQPGLWRLDIPLEGNPLKNLNSYLILGSRSLLVDTGFCWPCCREAMNRQLDEIGVDRDRMDIFLTHMHSDHSGLAPELIRPGCRIFIGEVDAPLIVPPQDHAHWHKWYLLHQMEGFSAEEIAQATGRTPSQGGAPRSLPEFHLLKDGQILEIGDHRFRCIWTPGHTPGHLCLYEEQEQWLFSGDHILFRISPNICRWSGFPDSLGDYLNSLRLIRDLPVRHLLPAHREETGILADRVDELLEHHQLRLDNTLQVVTDTPGLTGYQIAGQMRWRIRSKNWEEFPLTQKFFAVGETLAHLDYLEVRGLVFHELKNGVNYYFPSRQS